MWIEQTKTGKYKYVERYEDYKTGRQKRVSVTFDNKTRETQKKAKLILEEKIAKAFNESKLTIKDMNLFEAIDEWLKIYYQQVEDTTYSRAEYFKNKASDYFEKNILLSRINDSDWNNFLEDLLYNKQLSNNTVRIIKSKINIFISYCKQKGYIDENSCNNIKFTRKRTDSPKNIESNFLEDYEYNEVISKTTNVRYNLLFQWQYLTGMRIGEILALRKSDIHITHDRAYVTVSGTYSYINKVRKDKTKTTAGMRDVDLSAKAVEIYHQACKLSNTDFLFVTRNGKVLSIGNINTYLRDLKLSFDKSISTHTFRHTHVSKLAELGVPLNVIKDRVGHESSDITEKIYLHVTKNMKKDMIDKLNLL